MPSPFPGMDPYLESPELFPDLHDSLIVHLKETLMARLPRPYYAVSGSRIWGETARRRLAPDVRVHRNGGRTRGARSDGSSHRSSNGGMATLAQPVIVTVPQDETRETFVEIRRSVGKKHRLVTSIEILSPTNKTPGEYGRDLYRRKQRELLAEQVHLVEIDLLRGGEATTSVPWEDAVSQVGDFDYHVCCRRFDRLDQFFVYPIRLEDALPVIAIPLLPGDADVPLALQPLFDQVYDAGAFPLLVDYRAAVPPPPLSADKKKWIKKRLARRRG